MTDSQTPTRSGRLRTDVAGPRKRPIDRCYRFDRDFTSIGGPRIRRSSHTKKKSEFDRRNQLLTKLARTGQVALLHAFADGKISIEQLLELDDQNNLGSGMDAVALKRNLALELRNVQERLGPTKVTRKRYSLSLSAFGQLAFLSAEDEKRRDAGEPVPGYLLPHTAPVESLLTFDWNALKERWCFETVKVPVKAGHRGGAAPARRKAGRRPKNAPNVRIRRRSEADWNHLRRAISRFLSVYFSKQHPFRHRVMERIPHGKEPKGIDPRMSIEDFYKVLEKLPEYLRPVAFTLLLTGMRCGEYLACTAADLDASTYSVRVPGTKTASSARTAYVHEDYWPYIASAIPAPLAYKALRQHWKRAITAAFGQRVDPATGEKSPVKNITLHDLRRAHARWALEGGASLSAVQHSMGHDTALMTMRYARDLARQQVSGVLAERLAKKGAKAKPRKTTPSSHDEPASGTTAQPSIHEAIASQRAILQALGFSGPALEAMIAPLATLAGTVTPGG